MKHNVKYENNTITIENEEYEIKIKAKLKQKEEGFDEALRNIVTQFLKKAGIDDNPEVEVKNV